MFGCLLVRLSVGVYGHLEVKCNKDSCWVVAAADVVVVAVVAVPPCFNHWQLGYHKFLDLFGSFSLFCVFSSSSFSLAFFVLVFPFLFPFFFLVYLTFTFVCAKRCGCVDNFEMTSRHFQFSLAENCCCFFCCCYCCLIVIWFILYFRFLAKVDLLTMPHNFTQF